MNNENELLIRINNIIIDQANYENAIVINNGDILIRNKNKNKKKSILTDVFKEIIRDDIKKKRV